MLANPHCISERVFNADFFLQKIQNDASKIASKMSKKNTDSPLVLVFGVLQDNAGQFLTALEILSKVHEKHSTSMHIDTVRGALEDLQIVGGQIEMQIHRLGPKRIHTAVFKVSKP